MILYCDSSAIVKLYIEESGSDELRAAVDSADAVATVRISWAEIHAAFSRRAREVPEDAPALEQAKEAFARDWPNYIKIEVSQDLVELAGEYADTFALRGYDSVQLAAAVLAAKAAELPFAFACYDTRLSKAAKIFDIFEKINL